MENKIGYVLLDNNNNVIQEWIQDIIPNMIILPDGDIVNAPITGTYKNYIFTEIWQISNNSSDLIPVNTSGSYDGSKYISTINYRNLNQYELTAYSASIRYNKETSGVIVTNNQIFAQSNTLVFTDRQSQAMINGIITLMTLQPNTVISFKTSNAFVQANSLIMNNIANTVAQHVQKCFTVESQIAANIVSNTITSTSQIDSAYIF